LRKLISPCGFLGILSHVEFQISMCARFYAYKQPVSVMYSPLELEYRHNLQVQ
jgi:hypothetical protein